MKKKSQPRPTARKAQVHIGITNPDESRKELLTAALDCAKLIKASSEIHAVREKKIRTVRKLARVLREIKNLEKQLTELHLPEFSEAMASSLEPQHRTPGPREETARKAKKGSHPKTEEDKLNDELQKIEEKLKSL